MKLFALCMATAAVAASPPRIALNLASGVQQTNSYTERCTVGQDPATCPFPVAKAWDHVNNDISHMIRTQVYEVEDEGVFCDKGTDAKACRTDKVDFAKRSTYIFEYDVSDHANNKAEQVTFTLILDDACKTTPAPGTTVQCDPTLTTCPTAAVWQAAGDDKLCTTALAEDNVDTRETMKERLMYKIERLTGDKANLMCDNRGDDHVKDQYGASWWSYADYISNTEGDCDADSNQNNQKCPCALRGLRTKIVGTYRITWRVCDKAGAHGAGAGNGDNCVTKLQTVIVQDTKSPWIVVDGENKVVHECHKSCKGTSDPAECYSDAGSEVFDELDTIALGQTINAVTDISPSHPDASTVTGFHSKDGDAEASGSWMQKHEPYVLHYDAKDAATNPATQQTRAVYVVDTTAPTATLVGGYQDCEGDDCLTIQHVSRESDVDLLFPEDPGAICNDDCDTRGNDEMLVPHNETNNYGWGPKRWDEMVMGTYVRTYLCRDESGNEHAAKRTFINIDQGKPEIKLNGNQFTPEPARNDEEYTDEGATCHDKIDKDLSHAVEVSGDVVNLKVPGKYVLQYDCMDLSENEAVPMKRTVLVEDKTCPRVVRTGPPIIYLEAGFEYVDKKATATDDLDGDISDKIVTQGDTVNAAQAFYSRQSCSDIKSTYSGAKSGNYYITTFAEPTQSWQRVLVYCDMSGTGLTAYACQGCKAVHPYGAAQGDCSSFGLVMMTQANSHVFKQLDFPNKLFFPTSPTSLQDLYLCGTKDENGGQKHDGTMNSDMHDSTFFNHDKIAHAEEGKYVISYHVSDSSGNPECSAPKRTVIVRDTLPPVLALYHQEGNDNGKNLIQVGKDEYHGISERGVWREGKNVSATFPDNVSQDEYDAVKKAQDDSSLTSAGLMAEQSSGSVNGWLIAAAASAVTGLALVSYSVRKQNTVAVEV